VLTPLVEKLLRNAVPIRDAKGETWLCFRCEHHGYDTVAANEAPRHTGCEQCWAIFYLKMEALTPESERGKFLDGLSRVVANACQMERAGKWDLELTRPHIRYVDPAWLEERTLDIGELK